MEETPKTEAEGPKGSFCPFFVQKLRHPEGKAIPPLSAFGHFPRRGKQERTFLLPQISKLYYTEEEHERTETHPTL